MRRTLGLVFIVSLLATSALAASTATGARQLVLDGKGGAPEVSVVARGEDSITLEFELPVLEREDFRVAGESYQALGIPGGAIRGEAGMPGLPALTRLVALPGGTTARARLVSREDNHFTNLRPFPVQPDGAEDFVIDRAYYAGLGARTDDSPAITLGEPAILADLRVLPLTFHPVAYDPATNELRVARRMTVELEFEGAGERAATSTHRSLIPQSFDHLYSDLVLNYERASDAEVGPGTYLLIHHDDAAVESGLRPLLDWRRRQGYNVLAVDIAETGSSAAAIQGYIQGVYNSVNPPLEFVVLAGDATGGYGVATHHETMSGYWGEGDHYYSLLAGGDIISDVHVGRLSFQDLENLDTIVDKIVTYESAPPTDDAGWFTRAGLAGDPSSSGITTIFVNQWVKQQLLAHGYTQIDTMWSPNPGNMSASINQGLSAFGYRGFWNMSGMTTGYINALSNGDELPFAVIPTCGTGSFEQYGTCHSEAFLRAPNGGAIGCVGTATLGTHTRYNNCYYNGAWEGAINGSDHRLGVAHTRGKLELYLNYYGWDSLEAEIWSVWNNLMGDPATDMWMAFPATLDASHPAQLAQGANSLPLSVSSGGAPVTGALVALYKEGELRSTGYTDAAGDINLPIADYTAGEILVTVTKHDHMPYRGGVDMGSLPVFAAYESSTIDDDATGGSAGNGDGAINPGETIELPVALHNHGLDPAIGVTANITSADPFLTITDATESFGDIPGRETVWSAEDFDFTVAPGAPDGHVLAIDLEAVSGLETWTSLIELTVASAAFEMQGFTWGGDGATLDPGESGTLAVALENVGSIAGTDIGATLETSSPWVVITDPDGFYRDMPPGATAQNTADLFFLEIAPDCFSGHLAVFTLSLDFGAGYTASLEFGLQVGSAATNDPLGPDAHGYYVFDDTDTASGFAPIYDWVEIDPNHGGPGTSVGLSDFGYEQDDTIVMDLPFAFSFYGELYDQFSVCSNGWIAMGTTSLTHFRNWSIPAAGSPDAMIAPFWDNLVQLGGNQVYSWYDELGHRLIIQWSRMRNYIHFYPDDMQNFQVILYDPAFWQTPTGDGEIVFQYDIVSNSDYRDGRATVGIQDQDHSVGLLYSYAGLYPDAAAILNSGRAIRFLPLTLGLPLGTLTGEVTNASDGGAPLEGVLIRVLGSGQNLLSAEDGSYSGGIQAGTWTVDTQHESFATEEVADVVIHEDQVTVLDFALTDILGPYIENTTELPDTGDTAGPYVVDTWFSDYSTIATRRFFYRLNGGPHFELILAPVDVETGQYRAEIPGYPLGTSISYWLEAEDVAGNPSRDPEEDGTYYEFEILPTLTAIDEDFELDTGWTRGDAGDDATAGLWERVDPHGTWDGDEPVQPEDDASGDGTLCFVTGNLETGGDPDGDDVDDGKTSLMSPWIDLSELTSATLTYRRWYTNSTGQNPGEDYWMVHVTDDGSSWFSLEFTNASERSWQEMVFDLLDYIDLTSTVRFRFVAQDQSYDSTVEAGLDEFRIYGMTQPTETATPAEEAPARLTLLPNSPNPFNPSTLIRFGLPEAQPVSLRIFDASGRLVRTLLDELPLDAGYYEMSWDGRDGRGRALSSGVYFYRVSTETEQISAKATLLK